MRIVSLLALLTLISAATPASAKKRPFFDKTSLEPAREGEHGQKSLALVRKLVDQLNAQGFVTEAARVRSAVANARNGHRPESLFTTEGPDHEKGTLGYYGRLNSFRLAPEVVEGDIKVERRGDAWTLDVVDTPHYGNKKLSLRVRGDRVVLKMSDELNGGNAVKRVAHRVDGRVEATTKVVKGDARFGQQIRTVRTRR
jgi:hypothetical protein